MLKSVQSDFVKWPSATFIRRAVLIWLTLQNSVHTLLLRHVRSGPADTLFHASVAVALTELLKLSLCVLAVLVESGGCVQGCRALHTTLVRGTRDTARVAVLSLIYTLQNNLFYIAASHLSAAAFMILSQLKILTTAVCAVAILGQPLRAHQWLALVILFAGISLVQVDQVHQRSAVAQAHGGANNTAATETGGSHESPMFGLLNVVVAACLSGVANICFEKIVKGTAPVSLAMRNVQLAVCAVPISIVGAAIADGHSILEKGVFHGFHIAVWVMIFWYGIGGLSVAAAIKFADNLLKNFATSVAILLSTLGAVHIFNFRPTHLFALGAGAVISSIFLYGYDPEKRGSPGRKVPSDKVPNVDGIEKDERLGLTLEDCTEDR